MCISHGGQGGGGRGVGATAHGTGPLLVNVMFTPQHSVFSTCELLERMVDADFVRRRRRVAIHPPPVGATVLVDRSDRHESEIAVVNAVFEDGDGGWMRSG